MDKGIDVTALGELLIDFTENGISPQGNPILEANPGGAPCNVLAMLSSLDRKTAFIGKVGNDTFGRQLVKTLEMVGIETRGLRMDDEVHTTLAFVHTLADGDRDFSFYRNPGADIMLTEEEVDENLIENSKIFHYGTLSMTHKDCYDATKKAINIAQNAGCLLSFDPNLRPPLWKDMEDAKEKVRYGIELCDILKISDNEIEWFTGVDDYDDAVAYIRRIHDIPLILVSMGKEGSLAYYGNEKVFVPAFMQEQTIETTGAGDTFMGCILHFVLEYGLRELDEWKLKDMLSFANAAASIVTTRRGALKVMPSGEVVKEFLEKVQK